MTRDRFPSRRLPARLAALAALILAAAAGTGSAHGADVPGTPEPSPAPVVGATVTVNVPGAGTPVGTAAGTAIENRATLSYLDAANGRVVEIASNVSTVTIAVARRFTLEAPGATGAAPGATAHFPHVLRNTGNAPDRYSAALLGAPGAGEVPAGARLVLDIDGDGLAGPADRLLAAFSPDGPSDAPGGASVTLELAPGERARLVLALLVPDSARTDDRFATALRIDADAAVPGEVPPPVGLVDTVVVDASLAPDVPTTGTDEPDDTDDPDDAGEPEEPGDPDEPGLGTAEPEPAVLRFVGPAPALGREGAAPALDAPDDVVDREAYALDVGVRDGAPGAGSAYAVTRDGVYLELVGSVDPALVRVGPDGARHVVATVDSTLGGAGLDVLLRESAPGTERWLALAPFALVPATDAGDGDDGDDGSPDAGPDAAAAAGRCPADFDAAIAAASAGDGADAGGAPVEPAPGCTLDSGYADELVATIDTGFAQLFGVPSDVAVTDAPSRVFDATTGRPVAGARVAVLDGRPVAAHPVTGAPLEFVSDADGRFALPRLPAGAGYALAVEPPPGWRFPSLAPPGSFPDRPVVDASYGAPATDEAGEPIGRGGDGDGRFAVDEGDAATVIDVPLDPLAAEPSDLVLDKRVATAFVEIGDAVDYVIGVENRGETALDAVTVLDSPPAGFRYVAGTARLDGVAAPDPVRTAGGEPGAAVVAAVTGEADPEGTGLRFDVGALAPGARAEIGYRLQAGSGAARGDGLNLAVAGARDANGAVLASEVSRARVRLDPGGVFSERGVLFGKVWIDATCDGLHNDAEWPVPGVRLYLEDGRFVVTDEHGQWSLHGVEAGLHTVKLDRVTLPDGLVLVPLDTRHGADPGSRFARVARGELHRADFAAACPTGDVGALFEELEARATDLSDDWLLDEASAWDPAARGALGSDAGYGTGEAGADGDLARGYLGERPGREDIDPDAPDGDGADGADGADGDGPDGPGAPGSPEPPGAPGPRPPGTLAAPAEGVSRRVGAMGDPKALAAGITRAQGEAGTFLWPEDGVSDDGRFMVVVRGGIEPTLYVDDVAVPGTRIGERIENRREEAQIVAWYGVRLAPGLNRVEVRGSDPFGNVRVLAGADVRRPAEAARMVLRARTDSLPGDGGRSTLPIDLLVLDADATPVSGVSFVTLETSRGAFDGEDLRPREPGHQVRVEGGRAKLVLRSSEAAGRFRVTARTGDLDAGLNLVQLASGRPLIVAGTVEAGATLPLGDGAARAGEPDAPDEIELDSRAALFLKGAVAGNAQLTLAYDTDAERDSALLGGPLTDAERTYPVTGDAALRGYEARSRSRLYARLERDRHSLMWGDYLTDGASELDDLARTRRTLTGVNGTFDTGNTRVRAFAAEQSAARRGESFPGNGTAMLYELEGAPIVPNSEVVERVVTSRDNPGLELSAVRLAPGLDYRLDPVTGQLSFADPVPSADGDLNPVSIRASYDVDVGGDVDEHLVAGLRVERRFGERLSVGASVTDDADPLAGATLAGVQGRAEFGHTALGLSGATMRHVDGRAGNAVRIGLEHAWGGDADTLTRLTWARAETGFDNPGAGVAPGRTEWRLDHRQALGVATRVLVEALGSASDADGTTYRSAALLGERDLGPWSVTLGTRRIDSETADERLALTTGIVGLERRFAFAGGRPGSVGIEHERAFAETERQRSAVLARVGVHEHVSAHARWERERGLGTRALLGLSGDTEQLVAGLESDWIANTELFSEYRMRGALDGRTLEAASGARGRYELRPGLAVSPAFEYVDALDERGEDALALSIGVSDVRGERRRLSGQAEFRDTDAARYIGLRASVAARLDRNWTGLVREEFTQSRPDEGEHTSRQRLTFGLARRPKLDHARHLLLLAEWRRERGELAGDDSDRFVLSAHRNVKASRRLTRSERVAAKLARTDYGDATATTSAALADLRLSIDLARRWELDLVAGVLATGAESPGDELEWAAGAGVAWLAETNLRLALGWNVAGFTDTDLDEDGVLRQGLRAGLEFKFDEELFRWLEQ